jgi:OFA family oxalate/formate antiporter-like MFS transporter
MLYTAKGAGSLLVPVAAWIAKGHGWGAVFSIAMTFNVAAGMLALFVLKPMRARHFARGREAFPAAPAPALGTAAAGSANRVTGSRAT